MATWRTLGFFFAAFALALSLAAGCGGQSAGAESSGGGGGAAGNSQGGKGGCIFEGKTYRAGETFNAACNTCQCFGGNSILCTLLPCRTSCETNQQSFYVALAAAKVCDPALTTEQCTLEGISDLPCGCPTFLNPANGQAVMDVSAARETYEKNQCGLGIACGACPMPSGGFCNAEGLCDDVGRVSCRVNGTTYPDGATNIKDPFSCNLCECHHGTLGCTEIGCPIPCPSDTTPGQRCSLCGRGGDCNLIETGCFPTCDFTCPLSNESCVDGICTVLCR